MINFKELNEATKEGNMPKLRLCWESVEVDERHKVATDRAQTYSAASNQIQVCLL